MRHQPFLLKLMMSKVMCDGPNCFLPFSFFKTEIAQKQVRQWKTDPSRPSNGATLSKVMFSFYFIYCISSILRQESFKISYSYVTGHKKSPYLVRRLLQGNCLVASFLKRSRYFSRPDAVFQSHALNFLLIWLQAFKPVNFISLTDSFFVLL